MADKYACMRCKCAGAKSLIPYKIIRDNNGESVKFIGQLCERCYKELFETNTAPAPSTDKKEVKDEKDK